MEGRFPRVAEIENPMLRSGPIWNRLETSTKNGARSCWTVTPRWKSRFRESIKIKREKNKKKKTRGMQRQKILCEADRLRFWSIQVFEGNIFPTELNRLRQWMSRLDPFTLWNSCRLHDRRQPLRKGKKDRRADVQFRKLTVHNSGCRVSRLVMRFRFVQIRGSKPSLGEFRQDYGTLADPCISRRWKIIEILLAAIS